MKKIELFYASSNQSEKIAKSIWYIILVVMVLFQPRSNCPSMMSLLSRALLSMQVFAVCTLPTSHNHNSFTTNTNPRRRHQEEIADIVNGHPSTTVGLQLPIYIYRKNSTHPHQPPPPTNNNNNILYLLTQPTFFFFFGALDYLTKRPTWLRQRCT